MEIGHLAYLYPVYTKERTQLRKIGREQGVSHITTSVQDVTMRAKKALLKQCMNMLVK